jgi:E3 ubiquitin-protein ligase UBR4
MDSGEINSSSASGPSLSELLLQTMECLLVDASASNNWTIGNYLDFASAGISMRDIEALLEHAVQLKSGTDLHQTLMRVLPFLTYGNGDKMTLVVRHFDDVLRFDEFDAEHGPDKDAKMQAFVAMCDGIERKQIGNTMKAQMLELGIVDKCIKYIKVSDLSEPC